MTAATIKPRASKKRPARLAEPAPKSPSQSKYTSIRVSRDTRDILAREAAKAGVSLAAYLDEVAEEALRQEVFAQARADWTEALKDPEFVEEVMDWQNADLGVEFDDDGWPEYNEQ
ncbi:MAG: hypothetical protein LBK95_10915 [Bifidobacteriaceae bacterium]|jgi:hypothetical protein|nr:hypothetical protein [Bifidobacteriaceae bacterium]